jgi:hypothetical protein
LNDDNVDDVITNHKNTLIQEHIKEYKLQQAIAHFKA